MALVFPRDFPAVLRVNSENFPLKRYLNRNTRRGGKTQLSGRADPRWQLEWRSTNLNPDQFQEVEAFLESLQGGMNDFLAYRWERPFPKNYRAGFDGLTRYGGGAFDGSAYVDAVTASTITVSGLPATFNLAAGDMIGLVQSGAYGLHMLMEDVAAASGVATVTVQPFVKTNIFDGSASAQFARPKCRMMLDSYSGPRGLAPAPVTISAIQRII